MYKYDFDTVYNRKGSGCFKADALKMLYGKEDLLSLWVADMDFAIAPEIQEAFQKKLEHPIFGYNFRMNSYYETIINWIERRYLWQVKRDWILNTPGIVTAINVAVVTLTKPCDGILVQMPVYDPFFEAVKKNGRKLLNNQLKLIKGRYEIDFEDLEQKLKQSKMFILCNPHNPVGRVWTKQELLSIGHLCRKHKVIVISDEIHADIIYSGHKFIAFSSLEDFSTFTISCYSPSKSFNLAGLCTSAIIIPDAKIRKRFNAYVQTMHLFLGNTFGIIALQTAYDKGDSWLEALVTYLQGNRDYLCDYIETHLHQLQMIKPEGTYLSWIDCRRLRLTDNELLNILVENGLALSMGSTYGKGGSRFVRLNFGTPKAKLSQACVNLESMFSLCSAGFPSCNKKGKNDGNAKSD